LLEVFFAISHCGSIKNAILRENRVGFCSTSIYAICSLIESSKYG